MISMSRYPQTQIDGFSNLLDSALSRTLNAFPKDTSEHGTHLLNDSERETMVLVGLGLKNREIAKVMGISHNTHMTNMKRIHEKCDISSRSMLAVVSYRAYKLGAFDIKPGPTRDAIEKARRYRREMLKEMVY